MNRREAPGMVPAVLALSLLAACAPVRSPDVEIARPGPNADGGTPRGGTDVNAAAAAVTGASVQRRLDALTSGRPNDAPARGSPDVAATIAQQFRRLGLRPAGDAGSFLERGAAIRVSLERDSVRLRFESAGRGVALRYGADYVAGPGGGAVDGRAVLLGAEARADRLASVAGNVPLIRLHRLPTGEGGWVGDVHRLAAAAARAGVPALVFVLDARFDASTLPRVAAALEAPNDRPAPVPVFFVRYQAAQRVLRAAGIDPEVLAAHPSSALPLKRLRVQAAAPSQSLGGAHRVVALLPGSAPALARQVVVVSARYGTGLASASASRPRSVDHASADASGAAALLEVAAAFARMGRRPARPVLFVAATGEARTLDSGDSAVLPVASLHDAAARIDLENDGGGRDALIVVDDDDDRLYALFQQLFARHPGLRITIENRAAPGARPVPTAVIMTGPRAPGRPASDGAVPLDVDGVARVARLVFLAAERLSRAGPLRAAATPP